MKAKVEIENGSATIVLTPENSFEVTMLEDAYQHRGGLEAYIDKKYHNYGKTDYSLRVEITEHDTSKKPNGEKHPTPH